MHVPSSTRAAAFAALVACTLPAAAQVTPQPAASAPRAAMDMRQVIDHVASLGYRDIKEVERKGDKLYEVKARDAKGAWVELLVDARSGEILRSSFDR